LTRCTGGAQKEELIARVMEVMKAQAAAAEEEEEEEEEGQSDEEEAIDPTQVKEKLEALSEPELKTMLKEMQLPTEGKVSVPAPSTTGRPPRVGPQQPTHDTPLTPPQPHIPRWRRA
jgi:hypothetical protein